MKTFRTFFVLFIVTVFAFSINSCSKNDNQEELGAYSTIRDAADFKRRMSTQGDNVQILDFRSEADFDAGHIAGAKNIHATLEGTMSNNTPFCDKVLATFDKNRPLFMYGGKSVDLEFSVPGRISKIGFGRDNTYILQGGFDIWKKEFPNEIEKTEK